MTGPVQLIVRRRPRRRVFFAMMPLIDVMFLLLIFFMLSSQISPYALMPLGGVAAASPDTTATPSEGQQAAPLVVRLSHGQARIGGRNVALADLQGAAKAFVDQGISDFIVMPGAGADVQDVVTTLEALKAVAAREVTLVSSARTRP